MDTQNLYQYDEEYRDSIATVDKDGKRVWVYPKKPKGKYHRARIVVSVVLLSILFAGPFITSTTGNQSDSSTYSYLQAFLYF